MSILDKKGIGVTSGFKLVSGAPIDARFTAEDETDLQSLIDNGAVYEGLEVYVKSTKKKMQYNGTEFVEFKSASSDSGGIGKVFEDVTEIPAEPDSNVIYRVKVKQPSHVPNDGSIIGTLHFNHTLTNVEISKIIEDANIDWIDGALLGDSSYYMYLICAFDGSNYAFFKNDPITGLGILKDKATGKYILMFSGLTTNSNKVIGMSTSEQDFVWLGPSTGLPVINSNSMSSIQGIPVGTHNNKLTQIVSLNECFENKINYYNFDGGQINQINTDIRLTIRKKVFTNIEELYYFIMLNEPKILQVSFKTEESTLAMRQGSVNGESITLSFGAASWSGNAYVCNGGGIAGAGIIIYALEMQSNYVNVHELEGTPAEYGTTVTTGTALWRFSVEFTQELFLSTNSSITAYYTEE